LLLDIENIYLAHYTSLYSTLSASQIFSFIIIIGKLTDFDYFWRRFLWAKYRYKL